MVVSTVGVGSAAGVGLHLQVIYKWHSIAKGRYMLKGRYVIRMDKDLLPKDIVNKRAEGYIDRGSLTLLAQSPSCQTTDN